MQTILFLARPLHIQRSAVIATASGGSEEDYVWEIGWGQQSSFLPLAIQIVFWLQQSRPTDSEVNHEYSQGNKHTLDSLNKH